MRIQSTAPDRKALVKVLAEHLEEDAVYCGPPSFAYTIGGVTVDREGVIIQPDDMDTTGIQVFLVSNGWQKPEPEPDRMTITFIPAPRHLCLPLSMAKTRGAATTRTPICAQPSSAAARVSR